MSFAIKQQQYSMNTFEAKNSFLSDKNRTTMFPSLKKSFYKPQTNFSLDSKSYTITSNQILKNLFKKNQAQITKLASTFVKPEADQKINKKIGKYQVIKQIGKGGFAQVYEVKDQNHNKYALKQYALQNSIECFQNESVIGQFFFDKGALKQKQEQGRRHLIRYIEKFRIGKYGYVVQQLSEHNLSKLISDIQGVFHNNERVYQVKFKQFYRSLIQNNYLKKIMTEICQAVQLINKSGFIHCDLKLENIMIDISEADVPTVKLIDFGSTFELQYGLPKIVKHASTQTITPQYMPPQLLIMLENGSSDYQSLRKVDIWSIGCILLQIMTGVPLWFRYKCRVEVKGKQTIQLGLFALTGRQYHKIVKKQKQLCDSINRIQFTSAYFDRFRPILKRLLIFNCQKRATLQQIIESLQKLQ